MIRKMELFDVVRVSEIHVYAWRCAYRGIVSDDFLFNKMLVVKRIQYFERTFHMSGKEDYVYEDGVTKAFLTVGPCRDDDKLHAFELWGLYVDPFMQRQGIGTKMVDFCLQKAVEKNYSEVYLWVLERNNTARRFYEKQGFVPDGVWKYLENIDANEIRYRKDL